MSFLQKQRDASRSVFMSSVAGLANTIAVITTILGAPPLYSHTIGWIQAFVAQHYGYGIEGPTSLVWAGTCGSVVFFSSRMSISTAVPMLIMTLVARFL